MNIVFLDHLRESIVTVVRTSLPEPQASLLLGIIMGVKSGFPADFYEALRVTGTLHVVVVSGYNISVLISTLARTLIFLPLKVRFFTTVVFIVLFVLLVGPEAPVVRAAVMGGIALLGTVMGRQNTAIRAFLLSAAVMLLFNPQWATELSFQLSFLATLGLIVIFPLLDRIFPWRGAFLREDFLTTLSAQIMVWPLIAFAFGQVSLLSPLVNTLVLWTIPVVTYLGLITTTVALIVNQVGVLVMIPAHLLLTYFIGIVEGFAGWQVGFFEVSAFSVLALLFYFVVLGGGLWFLHQISTQKLKRS